MSETSIPPETTQDLKAYIDLKILSAPNAKIIRSDQLESEAKSFDLSVIPEFDKPIVEAGLQDMAQYLSFPIIIDGFTNHGDRRAWRTQVDTEIESEKGPQAMLEFNRIYAQNKIKRNALARIYSYSMMMNGFDENDQPIDYTDGHAQNIVKIMNEHVNQMSVNDDPWDSKAPQEKIDIVKQITNEVSQIVEKYKQK